MEIGLGERYFRTFTQTQGDTHIDGGYGLDCYSDQYPFANSRMRLMLKVVDREGERKRKL